MSQCKILKANSDSKNPIDHEMKLEIDCDAIESIDYQLHGLPRSRYVDYKGAQNHHVPWLSSQYRVVPSVSVIHTGADHGTTNDSYKSFMSHISGPTLRFLF